MTLADAIRKGAQQRKQGFGAFFALSVNRELRSCAVGAAYEGCFGDRDMPSDDRQTVKAFEAAGVAIGANQRCPACEIWPACASSELGVLATIYHLNDHHEWTRERIADWVDSVESA